MGATKIPLVLEPQGSHSSRLALSRDSDAISSKAGHTYIHGYIASYMSERIMRSEEEAAIGDRDLTPAIARAFGGASTNRVNELTLSVGAELQ